MADHILDDCNNTMKQTEESFINLSPYTVINLLELLSGLANPLNCTKISIAKTITQCTNNVHAIRQHLEETIALKRCKVNMTNLSYRTGVLMLLHPVCKEKTSKHSKRNQLHLLQFFSNA